MKTAIHIIKKRTIHDHEVIREEELRGYIDVYGKPIDLGIHSDDHDIKDVVVTHGYRKYLEFFIYDADVSEGSQDEKILKACLNLNEFMWEGDRYVAVEYKQEVSLATFYRSRTTVIAKRLGPRHLEVLSKRLALVKDRGIYYILEGRTPVECDCESTWKSWINQNNLTVNKSIFGNIVVETEFTGINFVVNTPPKLFETRVWSMPATSFLYSTWEEAEEGHKKACELACYLNYHFKKE